MSNGLHYIFGIKIVGVETPAEWDIKYRLFNVILTAALLAIINDISHQVGEILIPLDVCSLIISVLVSLTLKNLNNLVQTNSFSYIQTEGFVLLTKLCMQQNRFQIEHFFSRGTVIR